jgi:hypothetical protein
MVIKVQPNLVRTDRVDDIQTIGTVEQMYKSFVVSIDENIRSFMSSSGIDASIMQNPRGYNTDQEVMASTSIVGGVVDTLRYNESRCHAFYRNIGFPVVSPNGSFYNPGHDPNQVTTFIRRQNVESSLYSEGFDVVRLTLKREDYNKQRRDIFSKQDELASIYSILLRKVRPFLSAQTGKDPFYLDEQKTPIADRAQEISDLGVSINVPDIVTNVPHILKPFMVNPRIEAAVEPEQVRRVAVPFLGSPDDLITGFDEKGNNTKAFRPILEEVIINRLQVRQSSDYITKSVKRIIGVTSETSATNIEVTNTLLALSGTDDLSFVSSDVIEAVQNFSSLESTIATTLIKAIKVCIDELNVAIREVEKINSEINLEPIPDKNGPEFPEGGRIRVSGGILDTSDLQKKQAILELQRLVNERLQSTQDPRIGNNAYISAISVDLTKKMDEPISKLKKESDEYGRRALNYLSIIEKVTGEISGIGLVDILGIYTALYTIDMRYLIGFLDDAALDRLDQNFNELKDSEVDSQLGGNRPSIIDCLTEFERVFFNILSFADSLMITSSRTPIQARRGQTGG